MSQMGKGWPDTAAQRDLKIASDRLKAVRRRLEEEKKNAKKD
jgi:hypothetical protein